MHYDSISSEIAARIVSSLKDSIQYDITFIDTKGTIIACTDPIRVGKVHGGAVDMLANDMQTLVVVDDTSYPGSRSGINMRLSLNGRTIGIVGITGIPDEVARYGDVIRRMTELMLLKEQHDRQMLQQSFDINRFLSRWVQETVPLNDEFLLTGLKLGIDVTVMRRVVIAQQDPRESRGNTSLHGSCSETKHFINQLLQKALGEDFRNLYYFDGSMLIMLLKEENEDALCRFLMSFRQEVLENTNITLCFSCDNVSSSKWDVRNAYQRALQTMRERRPMEPISIYKNLCAAQLLRYVPKDIRRKYISKIFPGQTAQQIGEWCRLIDFVLDNNGSINAIAEQLYIHKNTVQYRIKKLENISGLDCRSAHDIPALYIAKVLWEQQNDESDDIK